jgi:S-DNA-T family DNA segregation ATPase FtsK/SpoIIIE
VEFLSNQKKANSSSQAAVEEQMQKMQSAMDSIATADSASGGNDRDVLFVEAGKFIIDKDKASIGMLQRWFKIGFNRAARIMDQLADAGVVGEEEGTKPRKVLMSMEEFEQYVDEYV